MSPNPQGRNVADEVWQVSSTGAKSNLIRTLTPGAYLWSMSPKALPNAQKKTRVVKLAGIIVFPSGQDKQ